MWHRLCISFDNIFLGSLFSLWHANRTLADRINSCDEEQFDDDGRLNYSVKDLEEALNISIQRIERIENKAMSTLLGVAVAVAVFGTATGLWGQDGLLSDQGRVIEIAAAILFLLALFYLLGSGLLALGAYGIGPIYRPTLEKRAQVAGERKEKALIIFSIVQNDRIGIQRANLLWASFSCLRNGLVVVLLLGVLFMIAGIRT